MIDFNALCQVVGNIYSGYTQGWLNDQFTQADSYPYHGYYLWGSGSCLSSYNVRVDIIHLKLCSLNLVGWILRHDVQQLLLPLLPLMLRW